MESGNTLIERAAAVVGSRYKLAQAIDEDAGFLGKIARGEKRISPSIAAKVAPLLNMDPRETVCATLVDLEEDPAERERLAGLLSVRDWRKR